MSLKRKMYRKQFKFVSNIIAYIIVLGFFYAPIDVPKRQVIYDYIPNWLVLAILIVVGIYIGFRSFDNISFIMRSSKKKGKCFWGLLKTDEPHLPINSILEQYGLLVEGFYQSQEALLNNPDYLVHLANDPDFCPQHIIDYRGFSYLNAFEPTHSEEGRESLRAGLVASWEITDQQGALATIENLYESAYQEAEINISQLKRYKYYDECIRDFGLILPDSAKQTNIAGFNIVRYVSVARLAFNSNLISEEDLRQVAVNAAYFVGACYQDWQQFAYSYLVTFIEWAENLELTGYDYIHERVYSVNQYLNDPHSPLHNTSLEILRDNMKLVAN